MKNKRQHRKAIDVGRDAMEDYIVHALFHPRPGILLEKTGEFGSALNAVKRAMGLHQQGAWPWTALLHLLEKRARFDDAITAAGIALERHPANAELHFQRGLLLGQTGDLRGAENACKETARLGRQLLDTLLQGAPLSVLAGGQNIPARLKQLDLEQLRLLARFLAHRAAGKLAQEAAQLNRDTANDTADAARWPLGAGYPVETPNPAVSALPAADKSRPDLSVMIPTYEVKSPDWLRRSIESILGQKANPDEREIIVVDDTPTNSVAETVAKSFGAQVKYMHNDATLGLIGNFNRCIELARGRFVHILHQDDWLEPGFYDALLPPLRADDRLAAAFSACMMVNRKDRLKFQLSMPQQQSGRVEDWPEAIALRQRVLFPSIIVRREAYETVGGFSPGFVFAVDWEMWSRLAVYGPVWYEPRTLANYRTHPDSETNRQQPIDRVIDCLRVGFTNAQRLPESLRERVAYLCFVRHLVEAAFAVFSPPPKRVSGHQVDLAVHLLSKGDNDAEARALLRIMLQNLEQCR